MFLGSEDICLSYNLYVNVYSSFPHMQKLEKAQDGPEFNVCLYNGTLAGDKAGMVIRTTA